MSRPRPACGPSRTLRRSSFEAMTIGGPRRGARDSTKARQYWRRASAEWLAGVDEAAGDAAGGAAADDAVAAAGVASIALHPGRRVDERNHQIVPARTATPATPNSVTNVRTRRPGGTGTASLGNGDDKQHTRRRRRHRDGASDQRRQDDGGGAAMNGSCRTVWKSRPADRLGRRHQRRRSLSA